MQLIQEQIETYLKLLAAGVPRVEAAQIVDEDQSTFQILSLDDRDFHRRYAEALETGRRARQMERAREMSQDLRDEFLENVRSGQISNEAARNCGHPLKRFRLLLNPLLPYYDPVFKAAYDEAIEEGRPIFIERMRKLAVDQAEQGHYRAIRDFLITYDPDWAYLRSQRIEVGQMEGEQFTLAAQRAIDTANLSPDERLMLLSLLEKAQAEEQGKPPLELLQGGE